MTRRGHALGSPAAVAALSDWERRTAVEGPIAAVDDHTFYGPHDWDEPEAEEDR
jgi:hypothetical protein